MRIKFIQKIIDKIRSKRTYSNIVEFGQNNTINVKNKECNCMVYGDNNEVIINTKRYFKANIVVGTPDCPVNNCKVIVGEEVGAIGLYAVLLEDNSFLKIGEDSMLSDNIKIYCSDTHSIIDNEGKLLNYGKGVEIGKHVWISTEVLITKNVKIADNCIIGMGSVVAKSCNEENSIIAGNPAQIVKRNINWSRIRPNKYTYENQK